MARPRLGDEERRTRTVDVRVTEAEAEELQERAQAARLSMGAYLCRQALGSAGADGSEAALGCGGGEPEGAGVREAPGADRVSPGRTTARACDREPGGPGERPARLKQANHELTTSLTGLKAYRPIVRLMQRRYPHRAQCRGCRRPSRCRSELPWNAPTSP